MSHVGYARVLTLDQDDVTRRLGSGPEALQAAEALLCDRDACPPHLGKTQPLEALNGNPIEFAGVEFALSQVLEGPSLGRA